MRRQIARKRFVIYALRLRYASVLMERIKWSGLKAVEEKEQLGAKKHNREASRLRSLFSQIKFTLCNLSSLSSIVVSLLTRQILVELELKRKCNIARKCL